MNNPLLRLDSIAFSWAKAQPLLQDIALAIYAGECVALVGENGAGKSTLLKLACGLEKPTQGRVLIAGLDTASARPRVLAKEVALMFQEAERQICHHSVAAEVAFAPRLAGLNKTTLRDRVNDALLQTGLSEHANAHPLDLNAGQRRLVTLAGLIAQQTPLLLLDEPTRDFDRPLQMQFESWLSRVRHEGRAILFISHDLDFIARQATRVIHLHDGRIIADGPPLDLLPSLPFQDATAPAPTLPPLCHALGLPATGQPETFAALWEQHWQQRQSGVDGQS